MNKNLFAIPVLLLSTACGGGGGSTIPAASTTYSVPGSYYGTVASSLYKSGKMGLTIDSSGNGSMALQDLGQDGFNYAFLNPGSIKGNTFTVANPSDAFCSFSLTATMIGANSIKGSYTTTCPDAGTDNATFTLPRGPYTLTGTSLT